MDRREFLETLAVATASLTLDSTAEAASGTEGHTLVCEFTVDNIHWKVHEDPRSRDGVITFVPSQGGSRVLTKSAEATFSEATTPYLGLKLSDIGTAGPDLLADKLLEKGDPDPEIVRIAAPPLGSATGGVVRPSWNTFVGTKECFDTMPVFPA